MLNSNLQKRFLELPNDSMVKTIAVAISLCLVCSLLVSVAAVALKPLQLENKLLDRKQNILLVAGIEDPEQSTAQLFTQIETRVVDMQTGEYTDAVDAQTYDQFKASKDPAYRVALNNQQDIAKIGGRAKYASVYLVKNGDRLDKIIIPVRGYGLWSTLFGFLALESDATIVSGITFYDHKETPGLGGEIENRNWQASWQGKHIVNLQGQVVLGLIKGKVAPNAPRAAYQIDGLAGASLTSKGVSNLIQFWVGENGFGPFLERIRKQQLGSVSTPPGTSSSEG